MEAESLTLMIQTCGKYSDLWEPHMAFLFQNWPGHPPAVLVTDEPTNAVFPGVEVFAAGAGLHMPGRLAAVLPRIQTEYILLTLDDYFPVYPIDTAEIARLVNIMDAKGLDYIRLFPDPPFFRPFPGQTGLFRVDLNTDYAVNLYPGLWRKSFLEATLPGPADIWAYEVSLTHTARQRNAKCAMTWGREFPVLDVIRKGKLLRRAKRFLSRRGICLESRKTVPLWEEIRIFCFNWGKKLLPRPAALWVKKQLRKWGFSFYTDQFEENYDTNTAN